MLFRSATSGSDHSPQAADRPSQRPDHPKTIGGAIASKHWPEDEAAIPQAPRPIAAAAPGASADVVAAEPFWSAEPSGWAGLVFLINLLRGLGLETWLRHHPPLGDGGWPRTLLGGLADQLGLPATDPLRLGLGLASPRDPDENAAQAAGFDPAWTKAV